MRALEVWGDPIAHSRSPLLHRTAYAELGWDWTYDRRRVSEAEFTAELQSREAALRGLSCTMPLKAVAAAAADEQDDRVSFTGAANTLLLTGGRRRAFNTDIGGIVAAVRETGVGAFSEARIVGAGATATSALVALAELGVERVEVLARRPEAARQLQARGARRGLRVDVQALDAGARDAAALRPVPLTLSTLPGDARVAPESAVSLAATGGLLFDVVYGHWPTALAHAWHEAGGVAVSGEGMLLHQAVLQIRIFATGDPDEPLPREEAVVAVMRRALMGG